MVQGAPLLAGQGVPGGAPGSGGGTRSLSARRRRSTCPGRPAGDAPNTTAPGWVGRCRRRRPSPRGGASGRPRPGSHSPGGCTPCPGPRVPCAGPGWRSSGASDGQRDPGAEQGGGQGRDPGCYRELPRAPRAAFTCRRPSGREELHDGVRALPGVRHDRGDQGIAVDDSRRGRAAVHRLRRAGHPGRARHRAVPGHRRGVPRGHRAGGRCRQRGRGLAAAVSPPCASRDPDPAGGAALYPHRRPGPAPGPRGPEQGVRASGLYAAEARTRHIRTYPIWCCCAGRITGRSTWPLDRRRRDRGRGVPPPEPGAPPAPLGPETTAHPGPSREHPEHAGGCEVASSYRTTTFTRFDHFDQPLEFFTRTAE